MASSAAQVVLAPADAVRSDGRGGSFVWVVAGNRAERVTVRTAGDAGAQVRIAEGLDGDEIVVTGEAPEHDGQKVRPLGEAPSS